MGKLLEGAADDGLAHELGQTQGKRLVAGRAGLEHEGPPWQHLPQLPDQLAHARARARGDGEHLTACAQLRRGEQRGGDPRLR